MLDPQVIILHQPFPGVRPKLQETIHGSGEIRLGVSN
jgi:hypothetical protein